MEMVVGIVRQGLQGEGETGVGVFGEGLLRVVAAGVESMQGLFEE